MVFVYDMPKKAKESAILDITKALKDKKLVNRLYKNYNLEEISQAHQKIFATYRSAETAKGITPKLTN